METSTSEARPPSEAFTAARAATAAFAGHPEPVRSALATADIVWALGADDDLALGALAAPLLSAGMIERPAALQLYGAEAVRLAEELRRLGTVGGRWNPDGKLSAAQAETLRKMLLAVVGDPRLILLSLAGRLYALRQAKHLPEQQQRQLALEAREIYAPLANRLGVWQLKWELEDLALRYLDPDSYRRIASALNTRRRDRERYMEDVRTRLQAELTKSGINAEVSGRPKHIYSIWRKMQRKQLPFEQVFDIRAVRVLVESVSDCYAALGIVHGLWPYIEAEFDDYIATPKNNDYRSIHTAVYGPGHLPVEVQIRTQDMHRHAELGVAAHWKYKEGGTRDAAYEAKIKWVRQLLDPAQGQSSDADFLDRIRRELFEDRVYAMTPRGEVVDLPRGATPLDFAYHVHTDLGHRCRGAKVNGKMVPLTHVLANGEVVEILTTREPQPNRDWLSSTRGFLVSTRSRSKVRAWFRKQEDKPAEPEPRPQPLRIVHAPRRSRKPSAPKGVIIEGMGDLTSNLARCCNPEPPLDIVGYITLTRGVSIHRGECASFQRMKGQHPERVLAVEWSAGAGGGAVAPHA